MSTLCDAYRNRLDLLTHGYVKLNIKSSTIPNEIIQLIKIWHSNHDNDIPRLYFNIVSINDDRIIVECYFDKKDWNILDIQQIAVSYDIKSEGYTHKLYEEIGGRKFTHFYDKSNLISFIKIKNTPMFLGSNRKATFEICAKDSNNNIIIQSKISKCYPGSFFNPLHYWVPLNLTDVCNKNKVSLKEWMSLKYTLNVCCNDLVWKRLFYYANFKAERVDDYHVNNEDFGFICHIHLETGDLDDAVDKIRIYGSPKKHSFSSDSSSDSDATIPCIHKSQSSPV